VTQAPVIVVLGGESYEIKPLVIKLSREWRREFVKLVQDIPALANGDIENTEQFGDIMTKLMVELPDRTAKLVAQYCQIEFTKFEEMATDAEIEVAFQEVVKLAFPLVTSLTGAVQMARMM